MISTGIMDQGYFVGRKKIFSWIQSSLQIQINSLEELGKGDIYCKLLDHFYPGSVNMTKIVYSPKMDHDIIMNLRYLQNAIDKLGIQKKIDITKISKCKPVDNLQFAQWLRKILQKQQDKISISYLNTSLSQSTINTQRISASTRRLLRDRLNCSNIQNTFEQNINTSFCQNSKLLTKSVKIMKKIDNNSIRKNKILVPKQRMKCIQALLSDKSITDNCKLQLIRNLVLNDNEKSKTILKQ